VREPIRSGPARWRTTDGDLRRVVRYYVPPDLLSRNRSGPAPDLPDLPDLLDVLRGVFRVRIACGCA
jgi:hypothetical protein